MRFYKEVGYDGMIMPDHVPSIPGDLNGQLALAYTLGYIQALIARVRAEGQTRLVGLKR
jgi:mannonate dehydratase